MIFQISLIGRLNLKKNWNSLCGIYLWENTADIRARRTWQCPSTRLFLWKLWYYWGPLVPNLHGLWAMYFDWKGDITLERWMGSYLIHRSWHLLSCDSCIRTPLYLWGKEALPHIIRAYINKKKWCPWYIYIYI